MPKARSRPNHRPSKKAAELPTATDWRTTDEQELLKRRLRAEEETFRIKNRNRNHLERLKTHYAMATKKQGAKGYKGS